MTSLFWQAFEDGKYNPLTVIGGFDRATHKKLFVVRYTFPDAVNPGMLADGQPAAQIPSGGRDFKATSYEVLVNPQDVYLEWIAPDGNKIPTGAVRGGTSPSGEKIFIARAMVKDDWVPGKFLQSSGCLVTSGGKEVKGTEFEIMCVNTVTPMPMCQ